MHIYIILISKLMVEPKDSAAADQKEYSRTYIMLGNPGVGKSTLLNGLLGQVRFKSGVSVDGESKTALHEHIDEDNNRFIDTPGLSDSERIKKVVEEIKANINKGGLFRIFFVVTLEAGGIRPADKKLMQHVLEAVEDIGTSYAVIVNKVENEKIQNKEELPSLEKELNASLPGTDKFYYIAHDAALVDVTDKVPSLSSEFHKFVHDESPLLAFFTGAPDDCDGCLAAEELTKQIDELEKEKDALQSQIKEQEGEIERMSKDKDELNSERLELEKLNFERLQRYAELEEERFRLRLLEEKQMDPHTEARVRKAKRSTVVYFTNRSRCNLIQSKTNLDHGIWDQKTPPATIEKLSAVVWASESNGFMTGTEGTAIYECIGHNCTVKVHWNNPFVGGNSYKETLSDTRYHKIYRSGESGNNAVIRYVFQ